jgi:hypothetical protein
MKPRYALAVVLFGFWLGSLSYQFVNGGAPLLPFASGLLAMYVGLLLIREGWEQARRLGSGPRVGDRVLTGTDRERLLIDWYANGRLTIEQFDLLMGEVIAGRADWRTINEAVLLAMDLKYRAEISAAARAGEIPEQAARTYLMKLPPGYFDGNISEVMPEDPYGWAEVRRGDGTSYWIRCRP